jgi:hypothetical protein
LPRKSRGHAPNLEDLEPDDPARGAVHAPNLTPDPTGLANWSDAEIMSAFRDGMAPGAVPLTPVMPYYVFHNMTDADALEILAYLRSVPPVFNLIPPREPLTVPLTAPAQPIPVSFIPEPIVDEGDAACAQRAQNGRYLAGMVAACAHCHTAPRRPAARTPWSFRSCFKAGAQSAPAMVGSRFAIPPCAFFRVTSPRTKAARPTTLRSS